MKFRLKLIILVVICAIVSIACLGIGRYEYDIFTPFEVIWANLMNLALEDEMIEIVIFDIRLPRICLALLVGASLSLSGAVFQNLFSNPLATPDTLGVASGASFGAVLAILLNLSSFYIQIFAIFFGILALIITYKVSIIKDSADRVTIILSGIIISAIFSALVSLCKYVADAQDVLPTITFWLLGSLSSASFKAILLSLPFILIAGVIIVLLRWKLNILSLSDDEIKSLGINLKAYQLIFIVFASMLTASSVAICGQVGWIGLLAPHIARMIFGQNSLYLIPSSIFMGALMLLIVDTFARSVSYAEIPVSILSAIIGAPLFIYLLRKRGGI
ncbi:iron ABC transporter permease [Campylobacter sp. FMV-PI01]|uniref:Iron ABC transporter permease n=1 Tax=Campylobacter portucalensis TaxID=2608384 RepID=A0A6L5WJI6_9BACT|nr:iron ABC transporter permease [Campylobacter portucalensis]MSN96602.1 iron ABC transporter permease [Campylobacter portucalensis]